MKSLYYQFVNFIHNLHSLVFWTIWVALLAVTFLLIVKFFNSYDEDKKRYKKISFLILSIILMLVLIFFTYLRH